MATFVGEGTDSKPDGQPLWGRELSLPFTRAAQFEETERKARTPTAGLQEQKQGGRQ